MIRKISIVSCVLFSLLCIVFFTACGNKSDKFGNLIQGFQKEYDNPCETVLFFSLANESQRKRFEEKTLSYLNNATKGDYGELMREIGDCTSIPFDKDGKQVSIFRGANDVALAKCSFYEIKLESDNLLPGKEEDIIVKEIRPKTIESFGMQIEKGKNPPDVFYIYKSGKYQNTLYYILTEKFYLAVLYVGKVENTDLPIKVFLMEPREFSALIHAFDKLDENSSRKKELSSLIQNSKLIKQLSEEYARLMVAANSSELRLKYGQYIYLLRQAEHERGRVDRVNQNTHSQQTNQEINKTVQKSKNEGVINGDEVNVRKGPGVKFDSLGVFFKGDKVRLVGEQGNDIGETWYQIEYDNPTVGLIKGWVRKDYININQVANDTSSNTRNQSTNNNDQSKDVFIEHWNSENLDIYVVDESLNGEISKTGKLFTVMVKQVQNGKLIKTHKWSFTENNGEWRYSTEEMDKKGRSSIVSESKIFEYCMKRLGWKYVKNGRYYQ